ncbi:unnamed protein product [Haemonchus placei]|uniref:MSP domain-containing protein n=1 Tax=Haemonchus placei TaxID=6290 RepID=A0A0N4VYR4_HAEPC|nr:unnamed protein product [Haemonchus placei]
MLTSHRNRGSLICFSTFNYNNYRFMSRDNENVGKSNQSSVNPDQVLSVDPEVALFTPAGGKSEHMLVNLSDKHLAVKVRCSNNALYRVRPVYQVVETGQCKSLIVTRLIGEYSV